MSQSFRPEIQGLRLISALLVASFHIWGSGVSGGVDVFFVLSGYFLSRGLIQKDKPLSQFNALDHISRFIGRTVPEVALVLTVCLLAVLFFMSPVVWDENTKNILFSALYLENFWLIRQSTEYLARSENVSLVQHFWAVSIIAQVYVSWILTVKLARLGERMFGASGPNALLAVIAVTGGASLAWGLYFTAVNPEAAYFDPLSRYWQFAAGAVTALMFHRVSGPNTLLSLLGLGLIVSCGFVIGSRLSFPGFAAIWPVSGAVLFLLFAGDPKSFLTRILSHPVVVNAGRLGFGVYLWHWPIYVLYLRSTMQDPGILSGLAIIALSFLLSWGGTRLFSQSGRSVRRAVVGVVSLAAIGVVSLGVIYAASRFSHVIDRVIVSISSDRMYNPGPMATRGSLPDSYAEGCHVSMSDPTVSTCTYNETGTAGVVHIVGGSHAAQWLPAFQIAAQELDFVLHSSTKSSCTFSEPGYPPLTQSNFNSSCLRWNAALMRELLTSDVDYIFAIGTRPVYATPDGALRHVVSDEPIPEGYAKAFSRLGEAGIEVVAVRDNPWMGFDVPACVYDFLRSDEACQRDREDVLPEKAGNWSVPENTYFIDFSDSICEEDVCTGVQDGTVLYRDTHHLTVEFVETLSEDVTEMMRDVMEGSSPTL